MSKKALVILSGGQDSTTVLFWAKGLYDEISAITFDYGQRHSAEINAALRVAALAGVAHHSIVSVPGILHGRSPLVAPDVELEKYESFQQMDKTIGNRVELTFVPMRNVLFLTLAANRAICQDIRTLVTGICQADNANYPDCRASFRDSMQQTINQGLGIEDFIIEAPLLNNSKAATIQMALELPGCYSALAFSHTSYNGEYPPVDKNHANVLRAQGFAEAGVPDPLIVRAWQEGLMSLPATKNYDDIPEDLFAAIASARSVIAKAPPRANGSGSRFTYAP